jgi:hypothetical protein
VSQSMKLRALVPVALAPVALALAACEPPPAPLLEHQVHFAVTSDIGQAVPGVRLFHPGGEIGKTGADGHFAARFRAADGAELVVHTECPDGYADPIDDTRVVLRQLSTVAAQNGGGLRVLIQCRRSRVLAAVVVRTGFPDLPVLYEGQEITRTGLSGVAHVSAAIPPHGTFSLMVDTSSVERIRPKNPAATFTMAAEDEFFVFDSPLERLPEPHRPKKHRPKRKPPPGPPRPTLVPPNAHLGRTTR